MRFLLTSAMIMALGITTLYAYAPHLPTLLWEGYPEFTWPSGGQHAEIKGKRRPPPFATDKHAINPKLEKLISTGETSAIAALHNGALKLEHFRTPHNQETRFNSFSLVKSLVGILTYRALADGHISSLSDPVGKYLPELTIEQMASVTVQALLDMKSGVLYEADSLKTVSGAIEKDLEQFIANPLGPMAKLHVAGVAPLLPKLFASKVTPAQFSYQNINTALLGLILERATRKKLPELLEKNIWRPAGAGAAYWRQYSNNKNISAYCCLYATTSDWLKVGQFIINNGTQEKSLLPNHLWRRIFGYSLSSEEVTKGAYRNHIRYNILDRKGEALQGRFTYFLGQGGQILYMLPEKKLVVIRFGAKPQLLHSTLYEIWNSIAQ